jgi:hypothetical protein
MRGHQGCRWGSPQCSLLLGEALCFVQQRTPVGFTRKYDGHAILRLNFVWYLLGYILGSDGMCVGHWSHSVNLQRCTILQCADVYFWSMNVPGLFDRGACMLTFRPPGASLSVYWRTVEPFFLNVDTLGICRGCLHDGPCVFPSFLWPDVTNVFKEMSARKSLVFLVRLDHTKRRHGCPPRFVSEMCTATRQPLPAGIALEICRRKLTLVDLLASGKWPI